MKAIILGGRGQLGRELALAAPPGVESSSYDRDELDISNADDVSRVVADQKPDLVLNAAAYTAVDKAEAEPDAARAVNVVGAANVARASADVGARLVHFSTDFVFDGAATTPYQADSPTAPLGVYGQTKLDGERAALEALPNTGIVLRTAWLYSRFGQNFVKTMLRLMGERDELSVVGDQTGSPTWAQGLATVAWQLASAPGGIYHWCDSGQISWYDFAIGIRDIGLELGLLDNAIRINRITTSEYPTAATRPAFSALDSRSTIAATGIEQAPWQDNLRRMLEQLDSI